MGGARGMRARFWRVLRMGCLFRGMVLFPAFLVQWQCSGFVSALGSLSRPRAGGGPLHAERCMHIHMCGAGCAGSIRRILHLLVVVSKCSAACAVLSSAVTCCIPWHVETTPGGPRLRMQPVTCSSCWAVHRCGAASFAPCEHTALCCCVRSLFADAARVLQCVSAPSCTSFCAVGRPVRLGSGLHAAALQHAAALLQ